MKANKAEPPAQLFKNSRGLAEHEIGTGVASSRDPRSRQHIKPFLCCLIWASESFCSNLRVVKNESPKY